jgi:SAM-dependent methyltransferase
MAGGAESWDRLVPYYDEWIPEDAGDLDFYVEEARRSGGPVVELGCGTGRVTLPMARAGVRVIGIDSSAEMLAECRRRAAAEQLTSAMDLRVGDFRDPPVPERVPLVVCPLRTMMHLLDDVARLEALRAVHGMLVPGGRFAFDVFSPPSDRSDPADDGWVQRGPNVAERDDLDWSRRVVRVSLRAGDETIVMELAWLDREEWRALLEAAGLAIHACYGWFDRRPCGLGRHSVWVAQRPDAAP